MFFACRIHSTSSIRNAIPSKCVSVCVWFMWMFVMGTHSVLARARKNRRYVLRSFFPTVMLFFFFRSEAATPLWELPNCSGRNFSERGNLQHIPACRKGRNMYETILNNTRAPVSSRTWQFCDVFYLPSFLQGICMDTLNALIEHESDTSDC